MSQPILTVEQLQIFHAGQSQAVLDQVEFEIRQGEIISILGPSGVGKSTLLSALASLHSTQKGQIQLLGQAIETQKSELAFMFQQAVLLPWLSIYENVAFGQNFKHQASHPPAYIKQRVENALVRVKLDHVSHAKPNILSGGMAQRVALARALAKMPKLLLLDEPFSALDELNRSQLQQLLIELVHREEIGAAVMVTHDIDEALLISDRIFFLSGQPAKINQIWTLGLNKDRDLWADEFSNIRNCILKSLHQHQLKTQQSA